MRKKIFSAIILALTTAIIIPFCFSEEKKADSVRFSDLIATTSETHLILFGVMHNSFTEEMISGLKSGVQVQFSFFVELFRKNKEKAGEQLADLEFNHTMTYDTLKDSYTVEIGESHYKQFFYRDLEDAKKTMNEVNGVKIIELAKLLPDSSYKLRIRANLFEKTLPLSLHRIMPFFSWWDKETEWHTIEFNY